jgi:hypothetical protein
VNGRVNGSTSGGRTFIKDERREAEDEGVVEVDLPQLARCRADGRAS